MEELRHLVQNLVILIMLAVFLELLLPQGSMQRYVKMVIGLLVIIAVLQMISEFSGTDLHLYVPKIATTATISLAQVQSEASEITGHYQQQALENYRQGIIKQVLALARLNPELTVLDAWVEVVTTSGEKLGKIQLIGLAVASKPEFSNESKMITPVEITVGIKTPVAILPEQIPPQTAQTIQNLTKTLTNFYNISLEQVQIIYVN
ncbi:MAG: stage III sporulation protein AF [Desulfotomaculum sp.]|nr:stage III sporulation protein AF [Desulfotomaculum sp.]